ncbi:MAG TPA: efflux RND transporter periplasmic adaptor subunit [Pseudomonas sp.]|nr:efflux RND transporter periplasmic adaptor subunit [Pseudomonas sp.]
MRIAYKTLFRLLLGLLVLALLLWLWRPWQGPLLTGYQLEERPLVQRVVASGEVSSQSLTRVGSELTGVVKVRHVREGDVVAAGDLLIELRDEDQRARLAEAEAALRQLLDSGRPQAEAQLRDAQSRLAQATRERERREAVHGRGLLSAEALEQARQAETSARVARDRARLQRDALAEEGAEAQQARQRVEQARIALGRTRIHAAHAGTVQTRNVEPGDLVRPGDVLLEIARADSREILLPLDEKNLGAVALGQPAWIIPDAWPERVLKARVSYLAPAVNPAQGTLDVHLELLDEADFLRQGMSVSVNIETARLERALVIGNDALLARDGARAQVLRVAADGTVERAPVRLGLRSDGLSEVREGLAAGDRVLNVAADPGERVRLQLLPLPGAE